MYGIVRFFSTFFEGINAIELLVVVVALFLLTNLSIHVNYIMPDIFTGILILFVCSSLYSWPHMSIGSRCFAIALITLLISVHLSHLVLAIGLTLVMAITYLCFHTMRIRACDIITALVVPIVLASILLAGSNFLITRQMVVSASSPVFLLARLIQSGAAIDYLRASCATKKYAVCDDLDRVEVPKDVSASDASISDNFLWGQYGIRRTIGDTDLFIEQAKEIDRETLEIYPIEVASSFIDGGLKQLIRFNDDSASERFRSTRVNDIYGQFYNGGSPLVVYFVNTSQYRALVADESFYVGWIETLRWCATVGAIIVLPIILVLASRKRRAEVAFPFFFGIFGVLLNGLVTGALSSVHDRYQSRVIWIVPLFFMAMALLWVRDRLAESG